MARLVQVLPPFILVLLLPVTSAASATDTGTYTSANLLYTPYPELLIGSEFLYGRHDDAAGREGEDYRLQFTFKHKFGRTF